MVSGPCLDTPSDPSSSTPAKISEIGGGGVCIPGGGGGGPSGVGGGGGCWSNG